MASDDRFADKLYIDRSIQTSPACVLHVAGVQTDNLELKDETTLADDISMVLSTIRRLEISDKISPADQTEEQDAAPKSPCISTTTRSLQLQRLSYRRPTTINQATKTIAARIVSLPETVPEYFENKSLRQTVKMRVVSMPATFATGMQSMDHSVSSDQSQGSILPDHDTPARIRVLSNATDAPHTPSPPSSPDSVLIIGSNPQISERFLQGDSCTEMSSPSIDDDDDVDWVSWTRSPPRPIPALHGPLSLPYARCPSGAEGTIIEGQDNLPRMIWGLEGEDTNRTRSEISPARVSVNSTAAVPVPRKPMTRNNQASLPPRFNTPRHEARPEAHRPASVQVMVPPLQTLSTSTSDNASPSDLEFALPTHGPIDLSQLTRPRSAMGLNGLLLDAEFSSNCAHGPLSLDLRLPAHSNNFDFDWPSAHIVREPPRNSSMVSHSMSQTELGDFLRPSSSSRSVSSLASSRSPIVLDPPSHLSRAVLSQHSPLSSQSTPLLTPLTSHNPLQRMSALEIAQKFRQQQLSQKQQQSMLPTPPSSSSPLWSSGFSPYQDSLWSPDGLTAVTWSGVPIVSAHSMSQRNQAPLQTEYLRTAHLSNGERPTGLSGLNRVVNQSNTLYVQSPTRPEDKLSRAPEFAFSANAIDLSLFNRVAQILPVQRRPSTALDAAQSTVQAQRSPSVPKPPPNTPMQTINVRQQTTKTNMHLSAHLFSPISSESSLRNLAQQHPRSVPLHRLIQRRLSAVPEEDHALCVDHGRDSLFESTGQHLRFDPAKGILPLQNETKTLVTIPAKQKIGGNSSNSARAFRAQDAERSAGASSITPSVSDIRSSGRTSRVPSESQPRGRQEVCREQDNAKDANTRWHVNRGRGRGRSGRRPRLPQAAVSNGPERVDGGMTVRS